MDTSITDDTSITETTKARARDKFLSFFKSYVLKISFWDKAHGQVDNGVYLCIGKKKNHGKMVDICPKN